ncbi:MAG: phosphate ABC transporter substrate-binding protein PstS [Leptospirillia bacterium]
MRPDFRRIWPVFASLVFCLLLQPPAHAEELLLSGSSMLTPLEERWVKAYIREHPDRPVEVLATGSGVGIRSATAGRATIGASDIPLTPRQKRQEGGIIAIPVALSGVVVAANLPSLPKTATLRLDGPLLARLFSGKIRFWDDPGLVAANPALSLPHLPVRPIHRSDASGTTFLFTSYLTHTSVLWREAFGIEDRPSWPRESVGVPGSAALRAALLKTPGAVGYLGLGWLEGTPLVRASLKNDRGEFVAPGRESVQRAAGGLGRGPAFPGGFDRSLVGGEISGAYPVVGVEFWTVNPDLPEETMQEVRNLLLFVLTRGQEPSFVEKSGFASLPGLPGRQRLRQLLREILPGNAFRPTTGG